MVRYPSHRRAGSFDRGPTPRILRWAEELGVKVPEGISNYGLSLLCRKAEKVLVRCSFEKSGIKTGDRIQSRITGEIHQVLDVDLERGQEGVVKVFIESRQKRSWLTPKSVLNNWRII